MIYHLLYSFHDQISVLNVVRYITFRTACASLTALLIALWLGPWVIRRLRQFQIGQQIREDGPASHLSKAGTPTMGGVLIVISIILPTLMWGDLSNAYIWMALTSFLLFSGVGFLDDYLKVVQKRSLGLRVAQKLTLQALIAVGIAFSLVLLHNKGLYSIRLSVPFFKRFIPELDLVILGVSTFFPLIL